MKEKKLISMQSINPATEKNIAEYPETSQEEVHQILHNMTHAQRKWARTSLHERSAKMLQLANLLEQNKDEYASLMTDEMGKPLSQAIGEVEKCAWVCRFYAERGPIYLEDEAVPTDSDQKYIISYQPLGIILAIMPWNFPFWQFIRHAAPSFMAGNSIILKHASNVSGCALAIQDLMIKAGFEDDLFRSVLLPNDKIGRLIHHPSVNGVTLTGSTRAGSSVAKQAGEALKKTVLELGGSDAYVILDDADIEHAADLCVTSRLINSGQSCISAKRFIIMDSVYDEFREAFKEKMSAKKMGDPRELANDVGPLAREDLRDTLHKQVQKSINQGAKLVMGGKIPDQAGFYYPPTILENVEPGMAAFDEELFGPVAAFTRVNTEEGAISVANNSIYGLGAAVFTKDVKRGQEIASRRLEAGCCVVNEIVKSDPRLPFGGIKQSGYGRELAREGIREFVNIKSVVISR
ncbi:MAG: NAD-dependent succinate-semialdehyde dehydrogenase [Balneolales bacterium]